MGFILKMKFFYALLNLFSRLISRLTCFCLDKYLKYKYTNKLYSTPSIVMVHKNSVHDISDKLNMDN